MNIQSGVQNRPLRVVIYGCEGIGKSSLASKFPKPVFIDTENGTGFLNVDRIGLAHTWAGLQRAIDELAEADNSICKTIVVDTLDRAESWCLRYTCDKHGKAGIEDFGYGKGYQYAAEEWLTHLLGVLDDAVNAGKNVVLIAHAQMRKFEQPDELGAYDRWELKLSKKIAPITKEWADIVLFCNYKTVVISDDKGSRKAQGGKRVMYAAHHPCWDAKNRQGLPDEMPLSFEPLAHLFQKSDGMTRETYEAIVSRMAEANLQPEELNAFISKKLKKLSTLDTITEQFATEWVLPNWDRIVKAINKNKEGENNE